MKAIGYVRVSTEEQATEGASLAAQEARIRAYATLRGLELVDVVTDAGVSGGKPLASRPGGARVPAAVAGRGASAVVVAKLDRAFRNAADCLAVTAEWDRRGGALHVLDLGGNAIDSATAAGRFMSTVLAGAAEMERNSIRERTAAALAHKKARGERVGTVPLGWAAGEGKQLVAVEEEQATVGRIFELANRGASFREIARTFNAEGGGDEARRSVAPLDRRLRLEARAAGGVQNRTVVFTDAPGARLRGRFAARGGIVNSEKQRVGGCHAQSWAASPSD